MSMKKQMNKFYAIVERAADRKPNTRVIQKMDDLRRIARHFKATNTTTLHPALTAKLMQALEQR
jgi:hypothetical protein